MPYSLHLSWGPKAVAHPCLIASAILLISSSLRPPLEPAMCCRLEGQNQRVSESSLSAERLTHAQTAMCCKLEASAESWPAPNELKSSGMASDVA